MNGNAYYEGYSIDLLEKLASMLHFTYEFCGTAESYGVKVNNRWTGIIGDIIEKVKKIN